MTAGAVRVRVLRHPARTDALALRLRLGTALATADLLPVGMSPSEVLCVRTLRDPRPGVLRLDRTHGAADRVWQRGVAGALDAARGRAARPACGAVPAGADAVVFADEAELLACLGADWLAGVLATRWWWRSLLVDGASGSAVCDAWLTRPRQAPAALELLAHDGLAVDFAVRLGPDMADSLTTAVASAHAMDGSSRPPVTTTGPDRDPGLLRTARPTGSSATDPAREPPGPVPWLWAVPEAAAPSLAPSARVLLTVSLALRRLPSATRRPGFLHAVRGWARAEQAHEASGQVTDDLWSRLRTPVGSGAPAPHGHQPAVQRPARPGTTQAPGGRAGPEASRPDRDAGRAPEAAGPARARATQAPVGTPAAASPSREGPPVPAAGRDDRPPADDDLLLLRPSHRLDRGRPADRPRPLDRPRRAAPVPQSVTTGLGGLFFLVDLALHLELLADFSAPLDAGIGIGPWDLVELLGVELLGDSRAATARGLPSGLRADPVWPLLAALSVRDPRWPPAHDVDLPDVWQVPATWLAPWLAPSVPPTGEWTWSATRGRLRVRHPAGFLLVDVRGTAADLATRTAPYAHLRPRLRRAAVPALGLRGRPARRWVRLLAAYVRPRLALAVGTSAADAAVDLVLRRPATVLVTRANVEVVLELADHPLEIRVAGLDRDPGWLPAAGRTLAFRFR